MGMIFRKVFGEFSAVKIIEWMNIVVAGECPIRRFNFFLVEKYFVTCLFNFYSFVRLSKSELGISNPWKL